MMSRARVVTVVAAMTLLLPACHGGGAGPTVAVSPPPVGPAPPSPTGPIVTLDPSRRIAGWVHTNGTRLVDQRGRTVRFTGVGLRDLEAGSGTMAPARQPGVIRLCRDGWSISPRQVFDQIASFGFNTVRVAVTWANLEPTAPTGGVHHWNESYLRAVDDVVAELGRRGIKVVLDMHQNRWTPALLRGGPNECYGTGMPGWTLVPNGSVGDDKAAFFQDQGGVQEGLAEAWRMLGGRFANNPVVIGADLLNEPYPLEPLPPASGLDRLWNVLGAAVRSVDPRILLVFEDSAPGLDAPLALQRPPPFRNEVYSYHLYRPNWDPLGRAVADRFLARARPWNVPLWVGEFDAFGEGANLHPPSPAWQTDTKAFLDYCRTNDIGWSFWVYAGASSLVLPGTITPKEPLLSILQGGAP